MVFLRDIFDDQISLGAIHNLVQAAIDTAQDLQKEENLLPITAAAHDEIFQVNQPVLAGEQGLPYG